MIIVFKTSTIIDIVSNLNTLIHTCNWSDTLLIQTLMQQKKNN